MALPIIKKNWCFTANGVSSLNQSVIANQDYNSILARRAMLYKLKTTLTGFAQGPWTVVQSANGLSPQSYGYADYWTSESALGVYSPGYAPWIVLQNTFAGQTSQILIAVTNHGLTQGKAYLLHNGTFGAGTGSPPAIPAAALKWCADYTTNDMDFFYNVRGISKLSVMQTWSSTEGVESIRLVGFQGGSCIGWGFLDRLYNIPTGGTSTITCPVIGTWFGRTSNYPPSYYYISATAQSTTIHAIGGTTRMQVFAQGQGTYNTITPQWSAGSKNEFSGNYSITKFDGVVSNSPPYMGYMGGPEDFWLGSNYIGNGTYYPSTSPQFIQFGHFIWPWDPTAGAPQTL